MLEDLSHHILDIAENGVNAEPMKFPFPSMIPVTCFFCPSETMDGE
jgi:hypothetical protein